MRAKGVVFPVTLYGTDQDTVIRLSGGDAVIVSTRLNYDCRSIGHSIVDDVAALLCSGYDRIRTLHLFIPAVCDIDALKVFVDVLHGLYRSTSLDTDLSYLKNVGITDIVHRLIIHQMKTTEKKEPHQFTIAMRETLTELQQERFKRFVKLDGSESTTFSIDKRWRSDVTIGYRYIDEDTKIPGLFIRSRDGIYESIYESMTILNAINVK